jgi:hypothetical protein
MNKSFRAVYVPSFIKQAPWLLTFLLVLLLSQTVNTSTASAKSIGISDNFDSYTPGSDIDGGSGGKKWTSNWTTSIVGSGVGTITATTSPAGGQGRNALELNGSGSSLETNRTFDPIATGTLSLLARVNSNPADTDDVRFGISNASVPVSLAVIRFRGTNITTRNESTNTTIALASYEINTWYRISIRFGSGVYAVSVNGAPYSVDIPYSGTGLPNNLGITIDEPGDAQYIFDVDDILISNK